MPAGYPKHNLPTVSSPWASKVQGEQERLAREFERYRGTSDNSAKGGSSSLALLTKQVRLLTALANVQYAEWTGGATGFSGWYPGTVASVNLTSPSGRIEIGFGGSLNGGNGYFCYSITGAQSGVIVDRAVVQANPARRIAASGGASFTASGHNQLVETVPVDESLTVKVELYAADTFVYFFGAHIFARVAP